MLVLANGSLDRGAVLMSFILHRHHTAASHLTAEALASLMVEEKPQLDVWYEEQHTHEQLALGNKTSRIGREIEEFLKDVEESVDGKTK